MYEAFCSISRFCTVLDSSWLFLVWPLGNSAYLVSPNLVGASLGRAPANLRRCFHIDTLCLSPRVGQWVRLCIRTVAEVLGS